MNADPRVLVVFGTRPEAIKMCPLIKELQARSGLETRVCVTGQHREMLDQVLQIFGVTPDYDLNVMQQGQSLTDITVRVLRGMEEVLASFSPSLVLVHGDTTTAFAAAVAAFYAKVCIGHVEAGLRTYDIYSPYPEEFNRQAISLVAGLNFSPTQRAAANLRAAGVPQQRIFVTGNTAIDALRITVRPDYRSPLTDWARGSRLLLVTAHRRENLGAPLHTMLRAIRRIVEKYPDVKAIYPVHMNPEVASVARQELSGSDRIRLVPPLPVDEFHNLISRCYLVLTDSGGIQEEATSLDKPVLVMRNVTERQEGLEAGVLRLVGTHEETICRACRQLLDDPVEYAQMCRATNPYGDGWACRRIADQVSAALNVVRTEA